MGLLPSPFRRTSTPPPLALPGTPASAGSTISSPSVPSASPLALSPESYLSPLSPVPAAAGIDASSSLSLVADASEFEDANASLGSIFSPGSTHGRKLRSGKERMMLPALLTRSRSRSTSRTGGNDGDESAAQAEAQVNGANGSNASGNESMANKLSTQRLAQTLVSLEPTSVTSSFFQLAQSQSPSAPSSPSAITRSPDPAPCGGRLAEVPLVAGEADVAGVGADKGMLLPPISDIFLQSSTLSPSKSSSTLLLASSPRRTPSMQTSPMLRTSSLFSQPTDTPAVDDLLLSPPHPAFMHGSRSSSYASTSGMSGSVSAMSSITSSCNSSYSRDTMASATSLESNGSVPKAIAPNLQGLLASGTNPLAAGAAASTATPAVEARPKAQTTQEPESLRGRSRKEGLGTLRRFGSRFLNRSAASPTSPTDAVLPLPAQIPSSSSTPARSQSQSTKASTVATSIGVLSSRGRMSASTSTSTSASEHSSSPPHTPQTPGYGDSVGAGAAVSLLSSFSIFGSGNSLSAKDGIAKFTHQPQLPAVGTAPSIDSLMTDSRLPQLPPMSLLGPQSAKSQRRSSGANVERSSMVSRGRELPNTESHMHGFNPIPDRGRGAGALGLDTAPQCVTTNDETIGDSDFLRAVLNFSFSDSEGSGSNLHTRAISTSRLGARPDGLPPRHTSLANLGAVADSSLASDAFGALQGLPSSWRPSSFPSRPKRLTEAQAKEIEERETQDKLAGRKVYRHMRPGLFRDDDEDSEDDYGDEDADERSHPFNTAAMRSADGPQASSQHAKNPFPSTFKKAKAPTSGSRGQSLTRPEDWPGLDTPVKRALYNCTLLKVHPQLASIVKETNPQSAVAIVEQKGKAADELCFPRSMNASLRLQEHESTYSVQRNLQVALGRSLVMRKLKRENLTIPEEVEIGWFQRRYGSVSIPASAITAAFMAKVSTKPEALARPNFVAATAPDGVIDDSSGLAAWARRPSFAKRSAIWTSDSTEVGAIDRTAAAPLVFSDRMCSLASVSNTNLLADAPATARFRKREGANVRAMPASAFSTSLMANAFMKALGADSRSDIGQRASLGRSRNRDAQLKKVPPPWIAPRDASERISLQKAVPLPTAASSPARQPMSPASPAKRASSASADRPGHQRSASVVSPLSSPLGSPKMKIGNWSPTTSDEESEEEVPLSKLRLNPKRRSLLPPAPAPAPVAQAASASTQQTPSLTSTQRAQLAIEEQRRRKQAELEARLAHEAQMQRKEAEERLLRRNVRELKEARERRHNTARQTLFTEINYGAGDPSRPSPSETLNRSKTAVELTKAAEGSAASPSAPSQRKEDSMLSQPGHDARGGRRRSCQPSGDDRAAVTSHPDSITSPKAKDKSLRSRSMRPPLVASIPSTPSMPVMGMPLQIPAAYRMMGPSASPHLPHSLSGPIPAWQYAQPTAYAVPMHPASYGMPHSLSYHPHNGGLVHLQPHDVPRSATQHFAQRQC
ncbi:hypothetical protein K437DRAFT_267885 [Tilletiaria anomala UBC 951]|uniref:Uncharacterized protein n=1 Tax=Tilletiaria anomala (strain ATCC 24038 / CBS 436.72 / UBC 951) TaxID=1037660 RepID=A0A066W8H4_TILAU|nr:uncharacterized protein K437DRAFT_267885 [Tilletiaria anomala UBC 951]KDN47344.1 hypothetical protein K437DRAFT_267885 [Tilletiaria anomala UBC 951]